MKLSTFSTLLRQTLALICALVLHAILAATASAQVPITASGTAVTENFDSMGTSTNASLPSSWKMSTAGAGTAAGYLTATNVTAVTQAASSGSPNSGGRYNWGSSTTDRAAGFMTSGSYNSPNALMVAYVNNTGSTITSINLTFTYERYRVNSAAASVAFFTSTDGSTWTAQTSGDSGAFATGTSAYTFSNGTAVSKTVTLTGLNIAAGAQFYVKWNFNTTGINSQGLGLDDVSLTATTSGSGSIPVITDFAPSSGAAGTGVTIGGSNFTGATNVTFNGVTATFSNVTATNLSATVPVGALTGPISVFTPSGSAASSSNFVVPAVSVVLPASITEGTSGQGEVRLNAPAVGDIEVALASSSTNDLTVDATVTVFDTSTNAFFNITAPADGVIDGNTNVTVTPTAAGYASSPGTISVVNVDQAKIPLSTFDSNSYTQNFDSLGTATISNVLSSTSNVQAALGSSVSTNLNGWFAAKIGGSSSTAVNIVSNDGSASSGALYNYGDTNTPANSDRSLGGLATSSFTGAFGALVVNNTGSTINSIIINLTGKFWRSSTSVQNVLTFGYGKVEGTTLNNNNFLSASNGVSLLPGANVVGPLPVTSNGPLNGNDPANQVAISNVAIPVTLAPGESMFFRWQDFDNSGNDAGLAIDNLSLTASTNLPLPVIGAVSIDQFSLSQTAATASSSVVSDGGASLTSRGFVYAPTSVSGNPVIGGSNVVVVTNAPPEVSAFTNTFTGLSAATSYSVRSFVVNGAGTNYSSAVQFSTLPVPPSFTGAYTQSFNGFTNMASLPLGWRALSTSNINTYAGDWNATNSVSAGFYGRTNVPGILGYLHTGSTGILSNTLTLVNKSGGTLTNLFVSYVGEVNMLNNTRFPSWNVVVDGQTNTALAYSTASGSNEFKSAEITGLNITNDGNIVITWWSDRGTNTTGSARMIGMTGVRVATNAASAPAIGVSGTLANFATTFGTASASQSFSASGSDLVANILVTAPTDYQVSLDNASFASSVTLLQTNGTVAATPVYLRIAATAAIGSPAGSVVLTSSGASSQNVLVSGTVSQAGQTFSNWSGGLSNTPSLQLKYAIGGASSPLATNGIAMSNAVTSSNLSITAIVRTNDPSLSVFGQSIVNLGAGIWTNNDVSRITNGVDQTGVPSGNQRQIFSTPLGTDGKKFLRLQTTLSNQ